eukprot:892696-Pelagomonas_calceolata.AAC.13
MHVHVRVRILMVEPKRVHAAQGLVSGFVVEVFVLRQAHDFGTQTCVQAVHLMQLCLWSRVFCAQASPLDFGTQTCVQGAAHAAALLCISGGRKEKLKPVSMKKQLELVFRDTSTESTMLAIIDFLSGVFNLNLRLCLHG